MSDRSGCIGASDRAVVTVDLVRWTTLSGGVTGREVIEAAKSCLYELFKEEPIVDHHAGSHCGLARRWDMLNRRVISGRIRSRDDSVIVEPYGDEYDGRLAPSTHFIMDERYERLLLRCRSVEGEWRTAHARESALAYDIAVLEDIANDIGNRLAIDVAFRGGRQALPRRFSDDVRVEKLTAGSLRRDRPSGGYDA